MSGLSPDTLFHFTGSFSNLLSILEKDFYPRYCYEDIIGKASPMVCFCDILLSQVKTHINTYGPYGLGMSKDWAYGKKLNPVLYVTKTSQLFKDISNIEKGYSVIAEQMMDKKLKSEDDELLHSISESWRSCLSIFQYLKPYSGPLYRHGRVVKQDIRFYDEKEWRYIPNIKRHGRLALKKEEYDDNAKLKAENTILQRKEFVLSFTPDDIKYVIVKNDKDIIKMVHALRRIKGNDTSDAVEILTSRIITSEQIFADF
jgi:hypothetical protein